MENIFLQIDQETIIRLISKHTQEIVKDIIQFQGGANSLVFKVITASGATFLVKEYIERANDKRDRFNTEYEALSFLWKNRIRNIPEPICKDEKGKLAIYRFIEGKKIKPEEISEFDIISASDFVCSLINLKDVPGASDQPLASEACFTINAYIECIDERLIRIRSNNHKDLKEFIERDFIPYYNEIKDFVIAGAHKLNYHPDFILPESEKILSQSDFGFHNAIKTNSPIVYFIDFEYYGWDDPAKLISDFYLQPEIPVPFIFRELFFKRVYGFLGENINLSRRLPLVFLLLSLKWCLIILNIFTRQRNGSLTDEIYEIQLNKARNKLDESKINYSNRTFPVSMLSA